MMTIALVMAPDRRRVHKFALLLALLLCGLQLCSAPLLPSFAAVVIVSLIVCFRALFFSPPTGHLISVNRSPNEKYPNPPKFPEDTRLKQHESSSSRSSGRRRFGFGAAGVSLSSESVPIKRLGVFSVGEHDRRIFQCARRPVCAPERE
jgi:hypothetical protein